jgi:hypothetical protein
MFLWKTQNDHKLTQILGSFIIIGSLDYDFTLDVIKMHTFVMLVYMASYMTIGYTTLHITTPSLYLVFT